MDEQRAVSRFIDRHDLRTEPAYRALDLVSEVGEIAKEINTSTEYGHAGTPAVATDEVGDALFALLALADGLSIDASDALEMAMDKYADRLAESGDAGSS